jgi:NCS1 family nucleobase:cation symporter-1
LSWPERLGMAQMATTEAPITLDQPAVKTLGFFDQIGLWGNLGVSLLGFTGALFVLQPRANSAALTVWAALTATALGTALGAAAIGLAAVPGTRTGSPAMVVLRGLFGGRLSYLPTGLNIVQLLGWGTFEIVIISSAAHQLWPSLARNTYVVIAGVITTALALRPLGVVRVLRKYVTVAVALVMVYLFIQLLRQPLPSLPHSSWQNFWPAVDIALAVAISWVPVAADYARHSTSSKSAFGAAFVGYTITQTACFALGIVAILSVRTASDGSNAGVWGAFIAVFLGKAAFAVLAIREIDQSFCDVYSAAVSTQNLRPRWDRRILALVIGTSATALALIFHIGNYYNFLVLIGSVFVPLFGVVTVDYFVFRGYLRWNLDPRAPSRWSMFLPWVIGFCVYQLVNPGAIPRWAAIWGHVARDIHFTPQNWMSASLLSFVAAAAVTAAVRLADRRPAKAS